ncbi:MAG: 2-dehydropantoate 2-reductase [Bacteroidia bacterium]
MKKTKIVIAGIGGVGGYFGGLLAKEFYTSDQVNISFLARGEHLKAIQNNGLKLIHGENELVVKPHLVTDNPEEIGIADYIILCTKSYDLETTIKELKSCINKDTLILPLLNGVNSREKIQNYLPENMVLDGCVYIVSKIKEAGLIEISGSLQTLFFGHDTIENEKLTSLQNIFKQANIEASLSKSISSIMWEKFIFISPTATATSYFDCSIGALVADDEKLKVVSLLINEIIKIARAKEIILAPDIFEKTVNKLKAFPFEATSSMHRDFQNNKKQTELELFTGYVVSTSKQRNIETPTYKKIHQALKNKS